MNRYSGFTKHDLEAVLMDKTLSELLLDNPIREIYDIFSNYQREWVIDILDSELKSGVLTFKVMMLLVDKSDDYEEKERYRLTVVFTVKVLATGLKHKVSLKLHTTADLTNNTNVGYREEVDRIYSALTKIEERVNSGDINSFY